MSSYGVWLLMQIGIVWCYVCKVFDLFSCLERKMMELVKKLGSAVDWSYQMLLYSSSSYFYKLGSQSVKAAETFLINNKPNILIRIWSVSCYLLMHSCFGLIGICDFFKHACFMN